MLEIAAAYELAKSFPQGIGGFFGSIVGGLITAWYLRKMLMSYLDRTFKLEKRVDNHAKAIKEIKAHLGLKTSEEDL